MRGKLREDIFQDASVFTKYKIKGDDRPDNVAYEVFGDANLDWLVLTCNNIINVTPYDISIPVHNLPQLSLIDYFYIQRRNM